LRHKGLTWDAQKSQITLKPHSGDQLGIHKIILTVYISNTIEVRLSVELSYFINSAPKNEHKLSERDYSELSELKTSHQRQLAISSPGFCTNSPSMLNLLNTAAYA
jgi:hypothetical protein